MKKLNVLLVVFVALSVGFFAGSALAETCALGHASRVNAVRNYDSRRALVFMGSSSIDFWSSMAADFPQYQTLNLGIAGSRYASLAQNAGACAKVYPAKNYVLYSGENDIAWLGSPEQAAKNFEKAVRDIHRAQPEAHVFVFNLKPSRRILLQFGRLEAVNAKLAATVRKLNEGRRYVTLIDINSEMSRGSGYFSIDGIHMTAKGYAVWTKSLAFALKNRNALR